MRALIFSLVFVLSPLLALGQAPIGAPEGLRFRTERAVVFKDGHVLLVKSAVGRTDAEGRLFTDEVPDHAILGSFWATPESGRLLSITAGHVERELSERRAQPCGTSRELLGANADEELSVLLSDGRRLVGRLKAPELEGDSAWSVLATTDGDVAFPAGAVSRIEASKLKTGCFTVETRTESTKRLTFRFETPAVERRLRLLYFVSGLQWIPTYRAELADANARETSARLVLQAELVNGVEDLEGVPIDLVVGVPHLRFQDRASALTLEHHVVDLLRRGSQHSCSNQVLGTQYMSNASMRSDAQRPGSAAGALRLAGSAGLADSTEGLDVSESGELFLHRLPALDLPFGHAAALPLFEQEVPVRQVHSWLIDLTDLPRATGGGSEAGPLVLRESDIWHQLELDNPTGIPWTTGPLLTMADGMPLGQDLLTYTPPGGRVEIPVTRSVTLRGNWSETETARVPEALRWNRRTWSRHEYAGRIELRNTRDEEVEVRVRVRLRGEVDAASDRPQIDKLHPGAREQGGPDPLTEVTWTITLSPGESVEREIAYHSHA